MGSDDSEAEKGDRVLAPDDLDITKQPEVEEIDDGRYVVSPNGPAKKPDRDLLENPDWLTSEQSDDTDPPLPDNQPTDGPPVESTSNQPSGGQQSGAGQSTPRGSGQSPDTGQQPDTDQAAPSRTDQQPDTDQAAPSRTDQSTPPRADQPTTQPTSQSDPTHSEQSTTQQADHSPGGRADQPTNPDLAAHDQPPAEPPAAEITNENVSRFLAQSLAQSSGDYGFDATLNVEGTVNRGRMTSDDIGETLETLLRWYAKQTTDEVEPEHVLGIILAGSDLAVEYPVQSVYAVVKRHGLGPDDSISDLLSAVRQEGSFTVPPSKE